MSKNRRTKQLFSEYFEEWVELYKVGAVRPITLKKYYISQQHIEKLVPDLKVCDITRRNYQKLLNDYAISHEKQTTMDFHHHLKGAILDAVDDGLIAQNPTRKIIIKGKNPRKKRPKFLNQHEVQALIKQMNLTTEINWDWFILLILKTGLRFSEALAVTPNDFDFSSQKLTIDKTWDYKSSKGTFQPTKNKSSKRKVQLDWQTAMQFSQLVKVYPENQPIFVKGRIFNSTVNNRLQFLCKKAEIPSISIHGLRHTHASLLLFADVSIATVARRLGHSSMSTTQETYLHIIQELENQDNDKIMRHLSTIG
ncbi:site-specific integrase [Lactococcus petauri]|nr:MULTISPECIES: site-specific integrase [Lactococcus]MCH1712409.1 site-specific integrase [Lactococcus petauri]QSR03650.1 site-specific integrase [Lactococcus sp. LG1267]QSR09979.1 site-specific integrase [Lactococcus sp. LG592]